MLSKTKNIFLWTIGIFLLLISLGHLITNALLSSLTFLVAALLTIPKSYTYIYKHITTPRKRQILRLAIITFLLFVGIISYPVETSTTQQKTTTDQTTVNTNIQETSSNEDETATVVSVTDGDTIRVIREGKEYPIRLIGINTPEINHPSEPVQCFGPEAKNALSNLLSGKQVKLEKDVSDVDKYNRSLRYVWLDETLINEYMALEGYAFSSKYEPNTKYQGRLSQAENTAKVNLKGLWATETCNGSIYTGTYKDPNKVQAIITPPEPPQRSPVAAPPAPSINTNNTSPEYSCSCSKTCGQMSSCEEAYYQLNQCGCSARDGDNDGIPCESIC